MKTNETHPYPNFSFKLRQALLRSWCLFALLLHLVSVGSAAGSQEPEKHSNLTENSPIESTRDSTPDSRSESTSDTKSCQESLHKGKEIYSSVFETKSLLQNTSRTSEKGQRLEQELWSDLQQLHHLLTTYTNATPTYDLLVSKNLTNLRETLDLNWRLTNKIVLELKVLETQGQVPKDPDIILRALLKLNTLKQSLFTPPCFITQCSYRIKLDQGCIFGNCLPHLTQDFHFESDGAVNAIWYFEYPVKMKLWGRSFVLRERRELEIDEGTLAIRAQNSAGKAYMESLIETAQLKASNGQPWIFIFMDLNNLGLLNYFVEGQKTGDAFISAFASVLRLNLLSSDHFFRVGGDEFVIISESRNVRNLMILLKAMMDQFYNNEEANELLENQWRFIENAANEIELLPNYLALSRSAAREVLKSDWLIEAAEDYSLFQSNFRTAYKPQILKGVLWQKFLMKPTFSVGSRIIQATDDYDHLVTITSRQSGESKKLYKEHQGANAIKLGGERTNEILIEENILNKRLILPPIFAPL